MEEGLDGEVAREALREAVAQDSRNKVERKPSGNRRRKHEESEIKETTVKEEKTVKVSGMEVGRSKGNRLRKHEDEKKEEWRDEEIELQVESEEQEMESGKEERVDIKEETEGRGVDKKEELSNQEEEENDDTTATSSRGGRLTKGVAKVLGGDILADKLVLRQIPLLLLCLVFLLLLVANRYQVESLSRKKIKVAERVNELREQQILLQKKNQESVRVSHIRDDLKKEKGLDILPTPPNVI